MANLTCGCVTLPPSCGKKYVPCHSFITDIQSHKINYYTLLLLLIVCTKSSEFSDDWHMSYNKYMYTCKFVKKQKLVRAMPTVLKFTKVNLTINSNSKVLSFNIISIQCLVAFMT